MHVCVRFHADIRYKENASEHHIASDHKVHCSVCKILDMSRSCISHFQVPACDFAWLGRELADVWNLRSSELSPSVIDMMRRSMEKPSLPSNNPSKLIMPKIAWGYWLHVLAQKYYAIAIKLAKEIGRFLLFFVFVFCLFFSLVSLNTKAWPIQNFWAKTQLQSTNNSFARDLKIWIFTRYISNQVLKGNSCEEE